MSSEARRRARQSRLEVQGTRHNVGFEIVDELARRHGLTFDSSPADAIVARWRERSTLVVKPRSRS